MDPLPDFLTRYYTQGDDPFISLNDLPIEQAQQVRREHCRKYGIGGFYGTEAYLIERKAIEEWIYNELIRKGGKPVTKTPVYMTLGASPKSEFDIRNDIQQEAKEIVIPLREIDMAAVSFTYPDSMYELTFDAQGKAFDGKRTNTPKVYLYHELLEIWSLYVKNIHYIEAQVWNREMLAPFAPI